MKQLLTLVALTIVLPFSSFCETIPTDTPDIYQAMRNANATHDSLVWFKADNAKCDRENAKLRESIAEKNLAIAYKDTALAESKTLDLLNQAQHNKDKGSIRKLENANLLWKAVVIVESVAVFVMVWKQAF